MTEPPPGSRMMSVPHHKDRSPAPPHTKPGRSPKGGKQPCKPVAPAAAAAANSGSSPADHLSHSNNKLRSSYSSMDDMGASVATSSNFSLTSKTRKGSSRKTARRVSTLLKEDIRSSRFFFRNLSIINLPETEDLLGTVMDAEHTIRSQCTFYASVMFQYIRHQMYNPNNRLIGVVGGGRLGRIIVQSLVDLSWPPAGVMVCTRDLNKVKDLQSMGVYCTNNHAELSSLPMIVLAVCPVHLQQLIEQMTGVLKPETLVVSIMAGVPTERLCKVLKHDLVVRTTVDPRRLPVQWDIGLRKYGQVLDYRVVNERDYFQQAAPHLVSRPDHMVAVLDALRTFGIRQNVREIEVEAILDEILFGIMPNTKPIPILRPPPTPVQDSVPAEVVDCEQDSQDLPDDWITSTSSDPAAASQSEVSSVTANRTAQSPPRRKKIPARRRKPKRKPPPPGSHGSGTASLFQEKSYCETSWYEALDDVIECLVWPAFQPLLSAWKKNRDELMATPSFEDRLLGEEDDASSLPSSIQEEDEEQQELMFDDHRLVGKEGLTLDQRLGLL